MSVNTEAVRTKRVFLGGTCNESSWRHRMIGFLHESCLDYFNPVVDDWDAQAQANELREREACDFLLYTLTPKMTGCYAVAEVVDDSNKRPDKTVLVLLRDDDGARFGDGRWRSLIQLSKLVNSNGVAVFLNLKDAAVYIGSL